MKFRLMFGLFAAASLFALPNQAGAEISMNPMPGNPLTDTGQGGMVRPVDLNDDGLDDLAIGSATAATGGVRIRIAGADGAWSPKPTLLAGSPVGDIVPADFDRDGNEDLLVQISFPGLSANDQYRILSGHGDGTFAAPTSVTVPSGKVVISLPTGHNILPTDIDGDGHLDLFIGLTRGQIAVARGHGDGSFDPLGVSASFPDTPTADSEGIGNVVAGDYNADGRTDYAFTLLGNSAGTSTQANSGFYVMYGQGGASFSEVTRIGMADPQGPITSAFSDDLNGDDSDDLIIAAVSPETTSTRFILYPGGNGGFATLPTTLFSLPVITPRVSGADFNRDGNLDLAWVERADSGSPRANNLVLATGNGSGGFTRLSGAFDLNFGATQDGVSTASPGDFNGDGSPDFAASFYSSDCAVNACGVSILMNRAVIGPATSSVDFGTVLQGTATAARTFTLTNTGSAPATLNTFVISGNEPVPFTISSDCDSIPAGGSCTGQVGFSTANPGAFQATAIYSFEDITGDFRVNLTGGVTALTYKAKLKLAGPKKFTAGKKVKVTATTANIGTAALDQVTLSWKAVQAGKTKARGQTSLATIAAGKSLARAINLAIPKAKLVRGKPVKLTVTASRDGKGTAGDFHVKQEFSLSVAVRQK
ncbi:MAG TPA: FG-GAP-like repeat-containing protein [Solirubrobacterales bacterium]|nr:FG-GAP-like repeat-containing protein [Solirubrobacterales bacterium]